MATGRERILVVTNDDAFGQTLKIHLTQNGYDAVLVADAAGALAAVHQGSPSLVLVDRRQALVAPLRRHSPLRSLPFIAVQPPGADCPNDECMSDLDHDIDMVICNQSYRQLIARVRAVIRREHLQMTSQVKYTVGDLHLDVDRHEVTVHGRSVDLTPKEFQILQQLVTQPSRVFSRDELLNRVWGEHCALEEHTLDVHIHSLRHKIEPDPAHPKFIVTVRGVGYKLRAQ